MSWTSAYSSEIAFWHALRRRAAEQAKTTRVLQPELLRMFVMQRFMARMFENPSAPWIVAGGTNLLIRIPGARSTRDIDLNTPSENYGTLDSIRSDLEPLTGENFELDPFDFTLDQKVGTFTGGLQGSNWRITATIAGQRAAVFGLDLAADDTTKVSEIERREVTPAISDMPGLRPPTPVPLFPLECQLADKIAGVTFRDVLGRSTGRYRDLVDLALYAGYVDINANKLRDALQQRVAGRDREVPLRIDVSPDWSAGYQKTAAATNLPEGLLTVEAATEAVSAWLDPLLQGEVPEDSVWDHKAGVWRAADDAPTKPGRVWVRPHTRDGRPVIDYYRRIPRRAF
ncbi:MAG: nucleotidyl transferase AbiEii/AbiGii toxin family protein [Mycobacterium sp.]